MGLAITKKITPLSTDRNYMRRVLRELFRRHQERVKSFDLIVKAQKTFDSADFSAVEKEFIELLTRLYCKPDKGQPSIKK